MSFTDPNQNQPPPAPSGWASRAPVDPNAPGGLPPVPVPPRNSIGNKARTIVGGIVPRLLAAGVALAIAGAGYWFFVVHQNESDLQDNLPAAGKCFSYVEKTSDLKVRSCADPLAEYKSEGSSREDAIAAGKHCDSLGAYVTIDVSVSRRNDNAHGLLCAALNLEVGDCITSPQTDATPIACAQAGPSDVKVLSLQKVATTAESLSDSKAMSVCPKATTLYVSDSAGKTIVCVGKA